MATQMRPASGGASVSSPAVRSGGDRADVATRATRFAPGDRVQCDAAQIGDWEAGVVMHYRQTDTYRDANGGYHRVRLDDASGRFASFDPGGQVCMVRFMRPYDDGYRAEVPSAKRSVGDHLVAQTYAGNWLPARIVAVDGAFFTVRFDDHDSTHDETVDAVRLRTTGTGAPTKATDAPAQPIRMNGGVPALPGTAWKMDFVDAFRGMSFQSGAAEAPHRSMSLALRAATTRGRI